MFRRLRTLIQNADEVLIDGQGITLKHGHIRTFYTHAQIDHEMIIEVTNDIRQGANPDSLPYDRTKGF